MATATRDRSAKTTANFALAKPGSLWRTLTGEASAAIMALPEDATAADCIAAVMAYASAPREWEPPHGLRMAICMGIAARLRSDERSIPTFRRP